MRQDWRTFKSLGSWWLFFNGRINPVLLTSHALCQVDSSNFNDFTSCFVLSDSKGVSEKTPTLKRYAGGFVKRILPARESSINDVFVNKLASFYNACILLLFSSHTKLTAIFAKCRKLLDQKVDYIVLHGLGRSIPKTIRLANLLKDALKSSINVNIRTGTVTVCITFV